MIREALPEGAFFDLWKQRSEKEDVYAYYFWGGQVQKRFSVPVKLLRREHGFSVRTGAEARATGLSNFRIELVRLLLPDRHEIESQIGNRLRIGDVQTVVQDSIVIPEDNLEQVVERVMLFRRVFTPYVIAAANRLGLSAIM